MKRKIIALGLAASMITVAAVSSTLAYLTDTDEAVNVFTVGNVDIKFDEDAAVLDKNGNKLPAKLIADNNGGSLYKDIVPTNVMRKDATVTNVGNTDAYVRVVVVMNNKGITETTLNKNLAAVTDIFTGWSDSYANGFDAETKNGAAYIGKTAITDTAVAGADEIAWAYYFKLESGAVADVFDGFKSPAVFDNAENGMFQNLKVEIYVDAIQVEGFDSSDEAFAALETAHPVANLRTAGAGSTAPSYTFTAENLRDGLALVENVVVDGTVDFPAGDNLIVSGTNTAELIYDTSSGLKSVTGGTYTLNNDTKRGIHAIVSDGDLTIANADIVSNADWTLHASVSNNNTLTISNVNVEATEGNGIYAYGNGSIIIENCKVDHIDTAPALGVERPWAATAVATSTGADMTINGGTYIGSNTALFIYNSGANVTINDGTFKAPNVIIADINGNVKSVVTINGGNFDGKIQTQCNTGYCPAGPAVIYINGGNFTNFSDNGYSNIKISGGTFDVKPASRMIVSGYTAVENDNGTWTIKRGANDTAGLSAAITEGASEIVLAPGEYTLPSGVSGKEFTVTGTEDTVIDISKAGVYLDSSDVSIEGVTIKGSTGLNGSDYIALYSPNVTYTNCTFDGPFKVGRDGAKFINCTFKNLGNDYIWTYGNDATFEGCTFNTDGKAILIYNDGGTEVSKVTVTGCTFNATAGAKAGAIANQNCAAIEIQNYGHGVDLTTSGNTIDPDFSGEWRIKAYHEPTARGGAEIIVNGIKYTSIALDGKTMTIDGDKNVTVNN